MTTAERKSALVKIMKMTKKRLVIIVAIVLVVLAGASVYAVWQAQGGRFVVGEPSKKTKDVPQYKPDKQQNLIDEVNKKYGSGDFSGAIALIEGQQNVDDVNTQLLLAGAYANSGDLKKALEVYKKLSDAGKLPKIELENMAAAADRAGEYQTALDTYKKAKEYAVSSGTQNDDQIAMYDYMIAELEKKL